MTSQGVEYTFFQFFDITEPINEAEIVFNCLCLRWATEDGIAPTLNFNPTSFVPTDIGEWYVLVFFFVSVRPVYNIVRSKPHSKKPFYPR